MSDKIQIKGVPPKWDQVEFERRLEEAVKLYRLTTQCREGVYAELPHDWLEKVAEKVAEGYKVCRNHSLIMNPLKYSCFLIKPEKMQQQDIEDLKVKVKGEYIECLEAERARYQDLLRQQLLQAQEEKERKAAEQAQAKKLAQIEAEVEACYSPLEIPD